MSSYVNINDFRDIRISDFLASLGHFPVKRSGKEIFYHSMLRETPKNTPSLSVWDEGGKWIDRAGANQSGIYGGGIIQLALAYWSHLPFKEVLHKMKDTLNITPESTPLINTNKVYQLRTKISTQHYAFHLVKTKPIGTNFLLTKYLESRGIYDVAKGHLQEVYYKNQQNKDSQKSNYAIGWLNEYNNFEFTTIKGFKSSIGAKGVSIIPGKDNHHAVIFESYMDYLSWLKSACDSSQSPSVYVLNSLTQLNKVINHIKNIKHIDLYLDNDNAGRQATRNTLTSIPHAKDQSMQYQGYKDYNEKLVDQLNSYFHSFKHNLKR